MARVARVFAATVILLTTFPSDVLAGEKYYVLVFASQGEPVRPRTSHTFVTVVKAHGDDEDDPRDWETESHTISWLPSSMNIVFRATPEPGQNFNLSTTMDWARRTEARVYLWGPFEIDRELYENARLQIARLERGWMYRLIGSGPRASGVCNCLQAACNVVPGPQLATGTAYGEEGSAIVARHYRLWIRDPEQTHDWLIEQLGLSDAKLVRRGW